MSSLVRSNATWNIITVNKAYTVVVLAEQICAVKANSYSKQVSIPVRTKCCPFHDGNSPVPSSCQHVAGWPLWGMVVPENLVGPLVNQTQIFSCSVMIKGNSERGHTCSWDRGHVKGIQTMSFCTTCLWNLPVPSRPVQVGSYTNHFHLMRECCCAYPTSRFWPGNT